MEYRTKNFGAQISSAYLKAHFYRPEAIAERPQNMMWSQFYDELRKFHSQFVMRMAGKRAVQDVLDRFAYQPAPRLVIENGPSAPLPWDQMELNAENVAYNLIENFVKRAGGERVDDARQVRARLFADAAFLNFLRAVFGRDLGSEKAADRYSQAMQKFRSQNEAAFAEEWESFRQNIRVDARGILEVTKDVVALALLDGNISEAQDSIFYFFMDHWEYLANLESFHDQVNFATAVLINTHLQPESDAMKQTIDGIGASIGQYRDELLNKVLREKD